MLRRGLTLEGYGVDTTADGERTVRAVAQAIYDLLVLDVPMPGVTGVGVCRRFWAGGGTTPILMLTARDQVEDRVSGLDAGADDHLAEPFELKMPAGFDCSTRIRDMTIGAEGWCRPP